ncbi:MULTISPECIES: inorganic diphosphatase [Nonlabens]|uniref:Inorganic pyrophosphatase n=1 Tax=Nonlabens xylanidelens TaxID=191564 RepID=A0A2S6IGB0_9FLAO|nr:inorganic diphosphatase [Nonlabens xylanidelens]PPK93243.1 inorganic pyrophosphatase [Nonlabens xylanidelens]PQJ20932.1 inorganic pyrophosphatase [Nonlabens xylanidelens]
MTKHAWHDVSYGADAPGNVTGIIEIPKNTRAKYELDKESGMLILDRVIYSSMYYPTNYGFIPQTYCDDNDPLDILVLSQIEIVPMCLVECKVIGVMQMLDGGEMDDKIIAVAANDMSVAHFNDIEELPEFWKKEMRNFFQDYKKLENKEVSVDEFQGREKALEIVNQSIEDYKKKFGTK